MQAILEQVEFKSIQKQFIRSLEKICYHDFPDRLPNLQSQIVEYLKSPAPSCLYAGLQGLLAVVSVYEFKTAKARMPLYEIVEAAFEVLGELVQDLITVKEQPGVLDTLYLICKAF